MNSAMKNSYLTLVYGFLYVPIIIVIGFSFNNSAHSMIWHGFTWHWYAVLVQDKNLLITALHSIVLGTLAASFATVIGTIAAICLYRYRFLGRKSLQLILFMLIILPDIVLGIALLLLYSISHFPLGFWSLLIAHITFSIPFATIIVSTRLTHFDKNIIEAGKDLGASEITILHKVLIPLLWPSFLAAWLLSFTLSLDDVIISYFVSGPNFQILPLKIFSMVKLGVKPEVNALSTLLLLLTLTAVLCSQYLLRKRQ